MSKHNKSVHAKKTIPVKGKLEKKSSNIILPLIILLVFTLIIFIPSFQNNFTNWDDPGYLLENNLVKNLTESALTKIFTTPVMGNYHPLSILSLAVEYHFFHLSPAGYHVISVLIHLLNTGLLYYFIILLVRNWRIAFITALLFGIHPMHVESVAWVAERKDVLYSLFYILSLCMYVKYINARNNRTFYYILTFIFFLLSLLSKAQAVTLPAALLLIDYFREKKFSKKILLQKIPLFIISVIFGVIAVIAQKKSGAITDIPVFSLFNRILFAAYGFMSYIFKLILPLNLSSYYPYPPTNTSLPVIYYIVPVILLILLFLIIRYCRHNKYVIYGVGFFIINILLLLQVVPVGGSIMSDRYSYLSFIGLFFIVAYLIDLSWQKNNQRLYKSRFLVSGVFAAYLVFISIRTNAQIKIWKNSETLWTNTITKYKDVVIAYSNRGSYYQKEQRLDEALADFNEALRLRPDHPETLINRSDLYRVKGQYDLALADCNKAISVRPDYPGGYINRGIVYCITGKYDAGFNDFNKVISLQPDYPNSYCNRGNLYDMKGLLDSALADYTKAISLKADYSEAFYNRGKTYMKKNNYDAALSDFNNAIAINKNYVEAYYFRSQVYNNKQDYPHALDDAMTVKRFGSPIEDSYINALQQKVNDRK